MERLIEFFNKCGIPCENIDELDGIQIPRERLLNKNLYYEVNIFIPELKKMFSSSSHTALHSGAEKTQQWPLLNLVRQTLKTIGYKLEPKRLCDGYDEFHKKKYRRVFIIKSLNNKVEPVNEEV
jgi:hypothetical protein